MTDRWYVAKQAGGQVKRYGPTSFEQLRKMAGSGKLQPTDWLCQQGMEKWLPAKDVEGLFPPDVPGLPPLPPLMEPAVPKMIPVSPTMPGAGSATPVDRKPAKKSTLAMVGWGFLVVLVLAALFSNQQGTPTGIPGNPGVGPGGVYPGGGFMLQGTYQRRSNDGTVLNDYITFTGDGQFQERGFLSAAAVHREYKTPDGQVRRDWGDGQQGGQGTYRFAGTTLELNYANGERFQISCQAHDGGSRELIINTRYTFVRVQ